MKLVCVKELTSIQMVRGGELQCSGIIQKTVFQQKKPMRVKLQLTAFNKHRVQINWQVVKKNEKVTAYLNEEAPDCL